MWGEVFEVGCMACYLNGVFSFPEIHHVKEHGKRNHSKVYGLCPIHHKATSMVNGIPNRHGSQKLFEREFGTDQELFELCKKIRGGENGKGKNTLQGGF
jgi:cytochrome c5